MNLKKALVALSFAALSGAALASCTTRDSWRGFDKGQHVVVGAAVAAGWTFQSRDPWQGFLAGALVGALKEVADSRGGGTCSLQDFAVTAAGAALGAAGSAWALRLSSRGTPQIAYNLKW